MRPNPVYHALKQQKIDGMELKDDLQGHRYFLIQLPPGQTALKLAGQRYQPHLQQRPHLTVYKQFNKKVSVLSPIHITWYGFRELPIQRDDDQKKAEEKKVIEPRQQLIEVHIYLNQVCRILQCQVKDLNTQQVITDMTAQEEIQLRRYGRELVADVFEETLILVNGNYVKASVEVDDLLAELDRISITTRYAKYKVTVERCITAIEKKDRWTFGKQDPRASLLTKILSACELRSAQNKKVFTEKGPQFYQPSIVENVPEEKTDVAETKLTVKTPTVPNKTQQQRQELLAALKTIDQEIAGFSKKKKHTIVETQLYEKDCLERQFKLISQSPGMVSIETELNIFQRINKNRVDMRRLFEEKALEGNLFVVKQLAPFVDKIDSFFFANLIEKRDLAICEFFMQNFDECLFYMNHMACSFSGLEAKTYAVSCLRLAYIYDNNLAFMKMLFENGVDPNFSGGSVANNINLLVSALLEKKWGFVELFLQYGMNPNLSRRKESCKTVLFNDKSTRSIRTTKAKLMKGQADYILEPSEETPLYVAIFTLKNLKMVRLLLEYGASMTERVKGFDAIGMATCENESKPSFDIVQQLVQCGADINAKQGDGICNCMTALQFACKRGNLSTVKDLMALGADPNVTVRNTIIVSTTDEKVPPLSLFIEMSPFKKAVISEHRDIVAYLLQQNLCPLTLKTLSDTCAYFFANLAKDNIGLFSFQGNLGISFVEKSTSESTSIAYLLAKAASDEAQRKSNVVKINKVIKEANETGDQHFIKACYLLAIEAYFVPLLFGDSNQRFSACYHIACCYYKGGQLNDAVKFFEVCIAHQPNSVMGKHSSSMLEKMVQSETPSMKP